MIRSLAERVTRRLAFKRRLPPEFGGNCLFVSPSAGLRYFLKPMRSVDPVLFCLVSEFVRPGNIVWDIGANVGLFAFSAAHKAGSAGQIVAVEPDTWLIQLLRQTAKLQAPNSASVTIVPCAIASSVGLRTFCVAARSRSANYLAEYGSTQTGGEAERQTVVSLTLDLLLDHFPAPDVLKIDAEGAELEVLTSGRKLFTSKRPTVLCEVSSEAAKAVTVFLAGFSYQLLDGEVPSDKRKPVSIAPWNTIAIPGVGKAT
jgi:FkbM family methyltransferase